MIEFLHAPQCPLPIFYLLQKREALFIEKTRTRKGIAGMNQEIIELIKEHNSMMELLEKDCIPGIARFADSLIDTLKKGGKLIAFGNGGSAADAQHFACELVGTFLNRERKGLAAIALTTNSSSLTSISNDSSYDNVFKRQLEALAKPGDICLGISTSGNAENVYRALLYAKEQNIFSVALSGKNGGKIKDIADLCILVPSESTPRIQEAHVFIIHAICAFVDEAFG